MQYKKSIDYIEQIEYYTESNLITDELFEKWLKFNYKLNRLEEIIYKLDGLIEGTNIAKKNINYNIDKTRALIANNDIGNTRLSNLHVSGMTRQKSMSGLD